MARQVAGVRPDAEEERRDDHRSERVAKPPDAEELEVHGFRRGHAAVDERPEDGADKGAGHGRGDHELREIGNVTEARIELRAAQQPRGDRDFGDVDHAKQERVGDAVPRDVNRQLCEDGEQAERQVAARSEANEVGEQHAIGRPEDGHPFRHHRQHDGDARGNEIEQRQEDEVLQTRRRGIGGRRVLGRAGLGNHRRDHTS